MHKLQLLTRFVFKVDDTDTTLQTISSVISTTFGIKTGFHGILHNTIAQVRYYLVGGKYNLLRMQMKTEDVLEEINETHMEAWTTVITHADPPVPNTPLTPYIEAYMLEKRSFAYKGGKLQRVIGYKLQHPKFGQETINSMIASFREDGTWPNVPGGGAA